MSCSLKKYTHKAKKNKLDTEQKEKKNRTAATWDSSKKTKIFAKKSEEMFRFDISTRHTKIKHEQIR